ncbi:hypothetical protein CCR95_08140 [Thiocystis minor]|uniref:hypothetical protein n=1 Tax=Thiocystis minor TaxID=61597 RepID=UPI0019133A67|nr:hypothetical protein [Thiocystis minor]MBK5964054.1 hypothetical protein [Thiocystis minor]
MEERHPDGEFSREPFLDLPASLGWRTRDAGICFADPPSVILHATPIFPLCHPELAARGIVWDSFSLLDSLARPGAYWILNCTCGIADDAGLEVPIFVSHPDRQRIVWELDLKGLAPALEDRLTGTDGFIRLTFARDEYESDLRALIGELRERATNPVTMEALSETDSVEWLQRESSHLAPFQVEELEPGIDGMDLERLLDLDPDNLPASAPLWPPGTLIEFGFFAVSDGHELMRVNGEVPWPSSWTPRHFTRWEAWSAFHRWVDLCHRGFWLGHHGCIVSPRSEQNRFFLLQEADRARCHAAGRHLADVVRRGYAEGETAPGVMVRDAECPLDVAERMN